MSARGHSSAPGMMRYGPPLGAGGAAGRRPQDHPQLVAQAAEIDRLLNDNRNLALAIRAKRQDLVVAQEEIKRLSSHIRSTETESDIQIRVLLEKIGKMESIIKAGEGVKEDLQQAHEEAQNLVSDRKELTLKIQKASQELEMYRTDMKDIPTMISEMESMTAEHRRLRSAFEHEKSINVDLVERMQSMERNLAAMSREVETLRGEVLKAEKRAQAPYDGAYPTPNSQYTTLYQNDDPYYDPYRRAQVNTAANGSMEGSVPHGHANSPLPRPGITPSPLVSRASAPMAWGGAYDPSTQRN